LEQCDLVRKQVSGWLAESYVTSCFDIKVLGRPHQKPSFAHNNSNQKLRIKSHFFKHTISKKLKIIQDVYNG